MNFYLNCIKKRETHVKNGMAVFSINTVTSTTLIHIYKWHNKDLSPLVYKRNIDSVLEVLRRTP